MYFSLTGLLFCFLVLAVFAYYWQAQGVRDIALRATRLYCQRHHLQLLDDSVALRAVWFKRGRRGGLHLWRAYHFEFSTTGAERYRGRTVMLGRQVEFTEVEAHLFPDSDESLH